MVHGVTIDTDMKYPNADILFSDCIIETRRHDPSFWGHAEPIYVNCGPWHPNDKAGQVRNVRFTNVLARGENGAYIGADAPGMVEGIRLDGVRIEVEPGSEWPGVVAGLRGTSGRPGELDAVRTRQRAAGEERY